MERDLAKLATLMIFGAILVDLGTHGSAFATVFKAIGDIWNGSLGIVAGAKS